MNEAFDNSIGTQRSDMGLFKKFTLNLTTVAVPNLIAHDLVIVHPMTSMSGYIAYVKYTAGSNKGETSRGDVFNDPFKLGKVDPNYTAARVVESFTGANSAVTAAWFPVLAGTGDYAALAPRIVSITTSAGVAVTVADDASVTVGADGKTLTISNGTGTAIGATDTVKVAYVYDNIVIPQNDLPIVNAEMASIPLLARARRVVVYYSQIAAFQAL